MYENNSHSANVGKIWKLANARTTRIFQDTQPRSQKSDPADLARTAFVNWHYVARHVLGRRGVGYVLSVIVWDLFQLIAGFASSRARGALLSVMRGKVKGLFEVLKSKGCNE